MCSVSESSLLSFLYRFWLVEFSDVDIVQNCFWTLDHARADEFVGMVGCPAISDGLEVAERLVSGDLWPASLEVPRIVLGFRMAYRIQYFRHDVKVGDIAVFIFRLASRAPSCSVPYSVRNGHGRRVAKD